MPIIKHRKYFFIFTTILVVASIISISVFGLKLGLDFTGGTLVQVTYDSVRPSVEIISESLDAAGLEGYSLREAGEKDYILRTGNLTEEQRPWVASWFTIGEGEAKIVQLTEVGPTIGVELRNKAILSLAIVLACILMFIAFAFRQVSKPISSWIYGLMAITGLTFSVLVTCGFFALLSRITGAQVDTLFITALLTILGFSVHDTIVVFDRTRENLRINQEKNKREDFEETAGRALGQTLVRSINTSVTIALSLLALFILGPESTQEFALTLFVGIVAGTYSSICVATPLLVAYENWRGQKQK